MSYFFTADLHLGHANILKYCNRPFPSIEEHDAGLISGINAYVEEKDFLYIVGDFSMPRGKDKFEKIKKYRDAILCRNIILIMGNHDPHLDSGMPENKLYSIFPQIYVRLNLKVPTEDSEQLIILDHYAGRVWNKSHYGSWMLYGHSHGSLPDDPNARSLDVGVDSAFARFGEYRPFSFAEIAKIMSEKTFVPVDHHRPK